MSGGKSKRLALVVGNSAYSYAAPLKNAANDAKAVGERLAELGFEVMGGPNDAPAGGKRGRKPANVGIDLDRKTSVQRFAAFLDRIEPGDTALIYYAGHGLQIADENFLVPVDASLAGDEPLAQLVRMRVMIEQAALKAGRAGTTLVFLDACRENPFTEEQLRNLALGARSLGAAQHRPEPMALVGKGFATMKMQARADASATFISFATSPGDFAYDGEGTNSPFTTAVVNHLSTRGLRLDDFIDRVASDVLVHSEMAGRYQDPWYESNLRRDFYFRPVDSSPVWLLALLSLIAGAIATHFMMGFDSFLAVVKPTRPETSPFLYLGGVFFAAVIGFGVWRWGSGKARDVAIAVAGTTLAFALAIFILETPIMQLRGEEPVFGGNGVSLSSILARERLLKFLGSPHFVTVSVLVLLAALMATILTALSLKPQRGGFSGFGTLVGSMSVAVLLPFMAVGMLWVQELMGDNTGATLHWLAVATGALWFMILGAQLGYSFMYHVEDYEPPAGSGR
ncbi:MAG: hypothetical protein RLZ98_1266 [Pseudomonadota bacterium]|jgi:uncharacterized caspase-like protein